MLCEGLDFWLGKAYMSVDKIGIGKTFAISVTMKKEDLEFDIHWEY